jgi:hypothetical protein
MQSNSPTGTSPTARRGSVLVVALLVILSMTGLGLVAFNTAVSASRTAGTFSMTRQANFATELGIQAGVQSIGCTFGALDSAVGSGMMGGNTDYHSTDPLCGVTVDYFGGSPFGDRVATGEFFVRFGAPTLAAQPTQSDSSICLYRVRMEASGALRAPSRANRVIADQALVPTTIRRRAIGYVYVGPIFSEGCGGQN